ncbi:MAG: hypothetical protein AAB842_02215 [Patescibacteria group bacterium]
MKNIVEALIGRAGGRIFHVSPENVNLCVTNIENNLWVISFEGISVTGKIYADSTSRSEIIFEVTRVEGQRELVGLRVMAVETEDTRDIVEDVARKAGEQIFHVSPATLYVNSPEDGVWVIFFEGVAVTGRVCVMEKEAVFEAIKVEGQRRMVGLKYTI